MGNRDHRAVLPLVRRRQPAGDVAQYAETAGERQRNERSPDVYRRDAEAARDPRSEAGNDAIVVRTCQLSAQDLDAVGPVRLVGIGGCAHSSLMLSQAQDCHNP